MYKNFFLCPYKHTITAMYAIKNMEYVVWLLSNILYIFCGSPCLYAKATAPTDRQNKVINTFEIR